METGKTALCWLSDEKGVREKTSIGGRIVDIDPGAPLYASIERKGEARRGATSEDHGGVAVKGSPDFVLSELLEPSAIWLGASGKSAFAARTGGNASRGIVEIFGVQARGIWPHRRVVPFGGGVLATNEEIRAHSLQGALGPDGTLHLVWIIERGDRRELASISVE
jgi:hypothetical protein